jgi:hypothetical protein
VKIRGVCGTYQRVSCLADQKETIVYEEAGKVEEGVEGMGMKLGLFGFVLGLNWLCIGFELALNWLCFLFHSS